MLKKISRLHLVNFLVILFFILLPYYLFEGKLFIGGDDTRLMYSYPIEYFKNVVLFSWSNFSAVGSNSSTQPIIPFMALWSAVSIFITSKITLSYLAFSTPLILSFVYFQRFVGELLDPKKDNKFEILAGSLFFVMSPILIINQLFIFLTTVWTLSLTFILSFYFIRYLKNSQFLELFKAIVWTTVLSLSFFSIPWVLGYLIPLFLGFVVIAFYFSRKQILLFAKKFMFFFGAVALSQAFWFLSFALSILTVDLNSPIGKVAHPWYISTFVPTVNSTAVGNIFYPIMNLFHRQIAFNFDWKLKEDFLNFYDKIIIFDLLFVLVLIIGLVSYRKYLNQIERKTFILFATAFLAILFLFTVNIGPLKDLFLWLGNLPGFVMFRNFYDKFAPSYAIIYSVLISFCLIVMGRRFKNHKFLIIGAFILIVFINFLPVKSTVTSALWTTDNTYKTINIPSEYVNTVKFIKDNISPTNSILSIPFGTSVYAVIKDEKSNNVYLGTSPVKIFSGVNDISGHFSFNFTGEAIDAYNLIISKDTNDFNKLLYSHNINYVMVTKNIPEEVKRSWVFDRNMLEAMDENFIKEITSKKIYTSDKGNYDIYETKLKNVLVKSKNLSFQKINQTKYRILIKGLKGKQELQFNDSYNREWNLYFVKANNFSCEEKYRDKDSNSVECKENFSILEGEEFNYFLQKPIFEESHELFDRFANQWTLDSEFVKNNFDKSFYKENKDGSIDLELVLYFKPQLYFYLGAFISLIVIIGSGMYLLWKYKNEKIN